MSGIRQHAAKTLYLLVLGVLVTFLILDQSASLRATINMASRARRMVRENKDPNFSYGTPENKGKKKNISATAKRQLKLAKQAEMQQNPDVVFCDLGEEWRKLGETEGLNIYDSQLYSKNCKEWKRLIIEHLERKAQDGKMANPVIVSGDNYPQIRVKGVDGKLKVTILFFYDTGIIMFQESILKIFAEKSSQRLRLCKRCLAT